MNTPIDGTPKQPPINDEQLPIKEEQAPQLIFKVTDDADGTPLRRENAFSEKLPSSSRADSAEPAGSEAVSTDFHAELKTLQEQQVKREQALRKMRLDHIRGWLHQMEGYDDALRLAVVGNKISPTNFLTKNVLAASQQHASDLADAAMRVCTSRALVVEKADKCLAKMAAQRAIIIPLSQRLRAAFTTLEKFVTTHDNQPSLVVRKDDMARMGAVYYDWLNDIGEFGYAMQSLLTLSIYKEALQEVAAAVLSAEFHRKLLSDSDDADSAASNAGDSDAEEEDDEDNDG